MTLLVKASIDDQIRRIADQFAPELKAAFLNAVEQLRRTINVGELADLIDSGAIAEMLAGLENVRVDASDVREALRRAAAGTGELVAGAFGLSFDMVNQRAVQWASDHAATLVTGIDTETMLGIRSIITQGQVQGITPRQQAQQIRRIVGLTKRDANAVSRFYEGLLPKVGFRMATDQAERYSNRLLRRRAENIARTETMTAANRGVQFGWTQAQEQGLLPAGTMKVWIATPDERTCPICAVLDGNVIDLAGSWRVDTQATAFTEQGGEFTVAETTPLARPVTTLTPPAHPSCRCTQGIDTVAAVEQTPTEPSPEPAGTEAPVLTEEQWAALDPDGFSRQFSAAEGVQALNQTEEGKRLLDTLDRWIEGDRKLVNLRNDIAKVLEGAEASTPGLERAQTLLNAVRQSPYQSPDSLYRGMYLKGEPETIIGKFFEPGSTVDMGLSSFTKHQKVANDFARWGASQSRGSWTEVVVEWVGDVKQSMPVRNAASTAKAWKDHEWVGGGRFRVVDSQMRGGKLRVIIEQVAGL